MEPLGRQYAEKLGYTLRQHSPSSGTATYDKNGLLLIVRKDPYPLESAIEENYELQAKLRKVHTIAVSEVDWFTFPHSKFAMFEQFVQLLVPAIPIGTGMFQVSFNGDYLCEKGLIEETCDQVQVNSILVYK